MSRPTSGSKITKKATPATANRPVKTAAKVNPKPGRVGV